MDEQDVVHEAEGEPDFYTQDELAAMTTADLQSHLLSMIVVLAGKRQVSKVPGLTAVEVEALDVGAMLRLLGKIEIRMAEIGVEAVEIEEIHGLVDTVRRAMASEQTFLKERRACLKGILSNTP